MITNLTKQDLIDFEDDILECSERGEIRAPVHLASGNHDQLIKIFQDVKEQDWVVGSWRMHAEALLKGMPSQELKQKILDGHSISIHSKKHKITSSAIVGGACPTALGLAYAAKEEKQDEKVFCFVGDMTSCGGNFLECWNYSVGHDLPITWVVSDNGLSVCSPTLETWGFKRHPFVGMPKEYKIIYYKYVNPFPHAGGKTLVRF